MSNQETLREICAAAMKLHWNCPGCGGEAAIYTFCESCIEARLEDSSPEDFMCLIEKEEPCTGCGDCSIDYTVPFEVPEEL